MTAVSFKKYGSVFVRKGCLYSFGEEKKLFLFQQYFYSMFSHPSICSWNCVCVRVCVFCVSLCAFCGKDVSYVGGFSPKFSLSPTLCLCEWVSVLVFHIFINQLAALFCPRCSSCLQSGLSGQPVLAFQFLPFRKFAIQMSVVKEAKATPDTSQAADECVAELHQTLGALVQRREQILMEQFWKWR